MGNIDNIGDIYIKQQYLMIFLYDLTATFIKIMFVLIPRNGFGGKKRHLAIPNFQFHPCQLPQAQLQLHRIYCLFTICHKCHCFYSHMASFF